MTSHRLIFILKCSTRVIPILLQLFIQVALILHHFIKIWFKLAIRLPMIFHFFVQIWHHHQKVLILTHQFSILSFQPSLITSQPIHFLVFLRDAVLQVRIFGQNSIQLIVNKLQIFIYITFLGISVIFKFFLVGEELALNIEFFPGCADIFQFLLDGGLVLDSLEAEGFYLNSELSVLFL